MCYWKCYVRASSVTQERNEYLLALCHIVTLLHRNAMTEENVFENKEWNKDPFHPEKWW